MELKNLQDLFVYKIMALYDVESEILKSLPKMSKKATDPDLKASLEEHRAETEEQSKRLEQVFEALGVKPKKNKCEGIRGLIADAEATLKEKISPEAADAAIAASARYVEHYEMAGYLSAIAWAKLLGYDDAADLLQATLEEEESAEKKLSMAAESKLNEAAMLDDAEEGEDDE